jgi:hypothetical protein
MPFSQNTIYSRMWSCYVFQLQERTYEPMPWNAVLTIILTDRVLSRKSPLNTQTWRFHIHLRPHTSPRIKFLVTGNCSKFYITAYIVEFRLNNILGRRGQLKCDGTRAQTRSRLSAKRTSPFKSARRRRFSRLLAAEVCAISGSNAGYTVFRGSVKGTGYPLHLPVSPSLPPPVRRRVPSHFDWTLLRHKRMTSIKSKVSSYVYRTVHHCDSWWIRDQLDVTSY